MRYTLTNNYHNTEADVISQDGTISIRAYRRAVNKLCGINGCACGGIRGGRVTAEVVNGYWPGDGYVRLMVDGGRA